MTHLPFTLAAYLLNSISVLVDKFLLTRHIENPLVYVFYFSLYSLIALLLLPFTHVPTLHVFLLASSSTLLWTAGAYFMFKALQLGLASRVIPIIGTFIPVFLLIEAVVSQTITTNQIWAVIILVIGLLFLTFKDLKGKLTFQEISLEFLASLLFAFSYIILKQAYLGDTFLTVFAYSRLILIPVGLLLFLIPQSRKIILSPGGSLFKLRSKAGLLFFIGQACGGSSELLLTFSISLATPALVNSLQGTQYVFLFIFSLILSKKYPSIFKENFSKIGLLLKVIGIIFIGAGLFILSMAEMNSQKNTIGVTFSPRYAQSLNLEPHSVFSRTIKEIPVKNIRLPVYWDEVEKIKGKMDYSDVDSYLETAEKENVSIILVVGFKQPRWPECYKPDWTLNYSRQQLDDQILKLVVEEVNHFHKFKSIKYWQVENEPFVNFGNCYSVDNQTLKRVQKEISIVRGIDPRPILITDSGELTTWYNPMKISDVFGTTLYRNVWNPILGNFDYPYPSFFYSLKKWIIQNITHTQGKQTMVSELQTEPWVPAKKDIHNWSVNEQIQTYPTSKLTRNLSFAKETGFDPIYLWGVEWWFWMEKMGHPEYLQTAKQIFAQ